MTSDSKLVWPRKRLPIFLRKDGSVIYAPHGIPVNSRIVMGAEKELDQ